MDRMLGCLSLHSWNIIETKMKLKKKGKNIPGVKDHESFNSWKRSLLSEKCPSTFIRNVTLMYLGGLICLPFNLFSRNSLRCRRERRPCKHQTSLKVLTTTIQQSYEQMSPYRIHGLLCLQSLGVFDGLNLLLVFPQHPDGQELMSHLTKMMIIVDWAL